MIITVGSTNDTKVNAVKELLAAYPMFAGAEIIPVSVSVEQFGHPKNIQEIVDGAMSRAKQAHQLIPNVAYSFGIESGLMAVPHTKSGFLETGICVIFDGTQSHIGMAPAFEWPRAAFDAIMHQGLDGSQAIREVGFTNHEKIGAAQGVAHLLTNGRLTRTEQNKLAIMMALIHLEHPDKY